MNPKKKILFFPFDFYSHFLRCFQLADAVREDFDVYFASSLSPQTNAAILERGYRLAEVLTIDAAKMVERESRMDHSWLDRRELEPIFLDQVRLLQTLKPDVVINDFCITLNMAAEFTHTPCYALIIGHLSRYYRTPRKPPENHPAVRFSRALGLPDGLIRAVTGAVERWVFRRMHRGVRALRREYFLQPRRDYLDELEAEHNLITDVEDFSPMRDLPANYTFVGPVFHVAEGDESEVLARLDPRKKTIFCTMGTFLAGAPVYRLFTHPGFRAYNVVVAGKTDVAFPPDVIRKDFVNLEALLPKTDLLICHGGDATIYQSIAHGTPLLGMPVQGEQTWSIQRAARLQLGEEIAPDLSAEQLLNRISYWLKERQEDPERFLRFGNKIQLQTSKDRFRNALLSLRQRRFCQYCHRGTFEQSPEVCNIPSDVRRFKNEYFQVWRCSLCRSIHTRPRLDMAPYYIDYPFERVPLNFFMRIVFKNFLDICRRHGLRPDNDLLYIGTQTRRFETFFNHEGFTRSRVVARHMGEPLPKGQLFDSIIVNNQLEREDDAHGFVTRLRALLKPGGRLILHATDAQAIDLSHPQRYMHDLHQPFNAHILSKLALLSLLKANGFRQLALYNRHFFDTYVPFLNLRALDGLMAFGDDTLDTAVAWPNLRWIRYWWRLPKYFFLGFFGRFFPRRIQMVGVFQREG